MFCYHLLGGNHAGVSRDRVEAIDVSFWRAVGFVVTLRLELSWIDRDSRRGRIAAQQEAEEKCNYLLGILFPLVVTLWQSPFHSYLLLSTLI